MGYYSGKMFNRESELKKSAIAVFEYDEISGSTCIDATGVNNGTYLGTYTLNQNGRIGNSLLSTETSIMTSTDNRKFTPELSPKSWNMWIKFNTIPSTTKFIMAHQISTALAYQLAFVDGYITFLLSDGFANASNLMCKYPISSLSMGTSEWYMFTVTYTGGIVASDIKMYFNGNLLTTTNTRSGSYSGCTYNPDLKFRDNYNVGYGILGYRDQLSVFDKELSLTEIQKLYNNGNGIPYSQF